MKSIRTRATVNSFAKKEIDRLNEYSLKSKRRYKVLAIILAFVNLVMIATAATGIELLVKYDSHHPDAGHVSLILASTAAAIIIMMFVLQFAIAIFRSVRKEDVYKTAMDAIQVEAMKFGKGRDPYTGKNAEVLLNETCAEIAKKAITKKHNKKFGSLLLIGLIGGEDA